MKNEVNERTEKCVWKGGKRDRQRQRESETESNWRVR